MREKMDGNCETERGRSRRKYGGGRGGISKMEKRV